MSSIASIDSIVNAVLYEGYMLYPYRASSVKNRQRWTFGGVYPQAYSIAHGGAEPWLIQTEFLVQGGPNTMLTVSPGFLHLIEREVGELTAPLAEWPLENPLNELPYEPSYRPVDVLTIEGQRFYTWQEASERHITIEPFRPAALGTAESGARSTAFALSGKRKLEPLRNKSDVEDRRGEVVGVLVRTRRCIEGNVEIRSERISQDVFRITVKLMNRTPLQNASNIRREVATLQALVSCHFILRVSGGRFISSIDPPAEFAAAVGQCDNVGVWPVLVGAEGTFDTMLASPIILYDYPQVAPESPGNLFDGTEIDEILTLRILTMTDQEKLEMAAVDPRARALLERTEKLSPQQLQQLHGTLRTVRSVDTTHAINDIKASHDIGDTNDTNETNRTSWEEVDNQPRLAFLHVNGLNLRVGDRVCLRPRGKADIFDLALAGKIATIESLERDFENRVHIAVTIDDDPGRDLGLARMPGHRFFFSPEEVEPVTAQEGPP